MSTQARSLRRTPRVGTAMSGVSRFAEQIACSAAELTQALPGSSVTSTGAPLPRVSMARNRAEAIPRQRRPSSR